MDRSGAGLARNGNYGLTIEVGRATPRPAVRAPSSLARMQACCVVGRKDCQRLQAQFGRRAENADGYLSRLATSSLPVIMRETAFPRLSGGYSDPAWFEHAKPSGVMMGGPGSTRDLRSIANGASIGSRWVAHRYGWRCSGLMGVADDGSMFGACLERVDEALTPRLVCQHFEIQFGLPISPMVVDDANRVARVLFRINRRARGDWHS